MERDPISQNLEAANSWDDPAVLDYQEGGAQQASTVDATESGGVFVHANEFADKHPSVVAVAGGFAIGGAFTGVAIIDSGAKADGYVPAAHVRQAPEGFGVSQAKDGKVTIPHDVAAKVSEPKVVRLSMSTVDAEVWPKANKPAETSGAHASAGSKYIKRHSKLQPQTILTKIAYTAYDLERGGSVKPTYARITDDAISYRSTCKFPDGGIFAQFNRDFVGTSYRTCGGGILPIDIERKSREDEYKPTNARLGFSVLRSVNINKKQTTLSVSGNRKKLTAKYVCPAPEQASSSSDLEQVTLRRARKGSRATIKKCD